jgi:hypothetical protein
MVFPLAILLKLEGTREIQVLLGLACKCEPFYKVRAFHFYYPLLILFISEFHAIFFIYSRIPRNLYRMMKGMLLLCKIIQL